MWKAGWLSQEQDSGQLRGSLRSRIQGSRVCVPREEGRRGAGRAAEPLRLGNLNTSILPGVCSQHSGPSQATGYCLGGICLHMDHESCPLLSEDQ